MLFLLATDPVGSLLPTTFKGTMTMGLVVIAGLALFAPQILAGIKSTVVGWVKADINLAGTAIDTVVPGAAPVVNITNDVLQQILTAMIAQSSSATAPTNDVLQQILTAVNAQSSRVVNPTQRSVAPASNPPVVSVDINNLVQTRAAALKNACPKAGSDLRLKWLEQGLDEAHAQIDYISILEQELDAPVVQPSNNS